MYCIVGNHYWYTKPRPPQKHGRSGLYMIFILYKGLVLSAAFSLESGKHYCTDNGDNAEGYHYIFGYSVVDKAHLSVEFIYNKKGQHHSRHDYADMRQNFSYVFHDAISFTERPAHRYKVYHCTRDRRGRHR